MDRENQLIGILSDRIAKAKINLEESKTHRKNIVKQTFYTATLIAFIGLYGSTATDKIELEFETQLLKKNLHNQQAIINNIGRLSVSKQLRTSNNKIISSCSLGLLHSVGQYVFCTPMPI